MDPEKVDEVAQFLVRIFGDEAVDLAAERIRKSEQPEEWRRVAHAVDRLLDPRQPVLEESRPTA